jgi:uncharacterized protein YggU (UPF0235/DUF167 family)
VAREKADSPPVVRLNVRAKPRASRSRLGEPNGLSVEAWLAAPPAEGAANEELLRLLAEALDLKVSALTLVIGHSSKNKVVEIRGLSPEEVGARLAAARGA